MDTGLPLDGVRLIPTIGNEKLRTVMPVGGVSKSVTFTEASPVQFVVQLFFEPLQEVNARTAASTGRSNEHFEFMQTPR